MDQPGAPLRLGAVVLAGGTAARMGGVDKASIEIDGVTLLERSLAATMSALEVVVVGDQVPTSRPVTWTREDPAGGGPAAGLLAGLDRFLRPPDLVVVLAVDMPRLNAGTVARLTWAVEADPAVDGAVLVDADRAPPDAGSGLPALRPRRRPAPRTSRTSTGCRCAAWSATCAWSRCRRSGEEARDVDTWESLRDLRQ